MGKFLAALQFLTAIPVPWRSEAREGDLGRSAGYFPLIGLIIGLILSGLAWLFDLLLPALADALLLVAMVILTGAMHLDGLADTCDGIAGHKTPEERWRVMRDSRAGAFGIVGVVLLLLVKYVSLNNIPQVSLMSTLILMSVVSRWAMTYAIFAYPYARESGMGKALKQGTNWLRFTVATLITVAVAAGLARLTGLAVILVIWLVTTLMATYFKNKFAGLTGDNYGALNEIAEVSVLIFMVLLTNFGLV